LKNPNRDFDAVVIGEPQREFYGNQFGNTFPLFVHFDVPLWVPEVGGPVDPNNEAHDLIMSVFGGMSKGERNRIKVRVRTAMAAQAQMEGRFLGGRPPYGYQLIDLGPHPNPAKAATERARTVLADCDRKLAQYRATFDAGGDPQTVSTWITEATTERLRAQAELQASATTTSTLSRDQITGIVGRITDPTGAVRDAETTDKASLYAKLGLELTYQPATRTGAGRGSPRPAPYGQ
jgi:hypothetical protein